jgi:quinol monooxygenase YgiN
MIKIVAKLPVKPEYIDAFKETAAPLIEASRAEEGNVFYTLNVSKSDPNCLTFIECWKDQAAIDLHNATPHFTGIFPKLMSLCSGQPVGELFDEI